MSDQNNNTAFQMIADVDGDLKDLLKMNVPQSVPILAVRNLVLFPGVVSPILIGRDSSKKLVQKAEKTGHVIGIICQRDPEVDYPQQEDLYEIGVYGKVMKQLTLPNGISPPSYKPWAVSVWIGSSKLILISRVSLSR